MDPLANYKSNPNYGNGIFRRRILLTRDDQKVHSELEDSFHGFKVTVSFKDNNITEIEPEFKRVPFTTCGGAETPLKKLIGTPLDTPVAELLKIAPPLTNCTHLHDLTILAITHSQQKETTVQYDVEIPDGIKGVSQLKVFRNNQLIHHWQAENGFLIGPENLKGKPLFMGFTKWANEEYTGIENEAAFVLQKGNLVSIGRMIDVDGMAGTRAIDESDRHACHTYSPDNAAKAIRNPKTVRDFTNSPEQLLKFT